ncbi:MAG: hypothetical protein CVV13_05535 [Gammaproteobacteria bacterium HGW-Gammaproteobacteria-3]|nr:MAG: hypothetical protein CVV13_05535 [Gammaproteobacteria bacterium HGW-Gammaproteobacteria-3]
MRNYDRNCPVCRLMRSLAFTGLGMGLGGGVAYLLGASRENIMLSGIVTAAILVFGIVGKKKN